MSQQPGGTLVVDANVLIDYVNADSEILALINRHLGAIYVPSPVLAEVKQLSPKEAKRLGIQVIEPSFSQATEAATRRGPISFQDRLCLIVARENNWACLTNDKPLRKACQQTGVACIWGLEAMGILVDNGHLQSQRAAEIAERIASSNPAITKAVLKRFYERLGR